MSEQIKVGDLVMVVRPTLCCSNTTSLGVIFKVADLGKVDGYLDRCSGCGKISLAVPSAYCADDKLWTELSRLLRIDPPSDELKRETAKELGNV